MSGTPSDRYQRDLQMEDIVSAIPMDQLRESGHPISRLTVTGETEWLLPWNERAEKKQATTRQHARSLV